MTPVEKGMTFSIFMFKSEAISLQYLFTSIKPLGPLAALALPALINKTFFPCEEEHRLSIARFTGAALNLLEVNFPLILA